MKNEYVLAQGIESNGKIGVKILISADRKLKDDEERMCREFCSNLVDAIQYHDEKTSLEAIQKVKDERAQILSLFPSVIYVRDIPNEYWPKNYGFYYFPWFIVTTAIGHIKIGCRKRVIVIDWTDTDVKQSADELFPDENVTKINKSIHAWGYDKAREYISKLLTPNQ